MKTVTVTARKAFTYATRDCVAGDRVDMTPLDAAVHARRGYVSLTRTSATPTPATSEPETPRRKRTYKRRDLVAEDSNS